MSIEWNGSDEFKKEQPNDVRGSSLEKVAGIFNFFTTKSFSSAILNGPSDMLEEEDEVEGDSFPGRDDSESD